MRIRSIKPDFWRSDDIAKLDWHTRLVFIGLWSYVDDNGVGRDNERLITNDLFPQEEDPRETLATVSRALASLARASLITRYTVDGKPLLHVTTWTQHQRIDKPAKKRYEPPSSDDASIRVDLATASRDTSESSAPGEGRREKGEEEKGEEEKGETAPAASRRATQLPSDFAVTEDMHAWAAKEAPGVNVITATAKFADHHTAKGTTFKDWTAAWRTWMRREHPDPNYRAPLRVIPGVEITDDQLLEILGKDRWSLPLHPEDIEPGTSAYRDWARAQQVARRQQRVAEATELLQRRAAR